MIPNAASTSMSGSVSSSVRWVLEGEGQKTRGYAVESLDFVRLAFSDALTIFVPENTSWRSTFSSAIFCCDRC